MKVDIDPARRSFTSTGTFTLVNRTSAPIRQIHLFDANRTALKSATFDRPFKPQSADKELGYSIYALDSPLEPGGSLHMTFDVGHESKGFAHRGTGRVRVQRHVLRPIVLPVHRLSARCRAGR